MGLDVRHVNCGSIQSPTNTPRGKSALTQVFALPWIKKDLEKTFIMIRLLPTGLLSNDLESPSSKLLERVMPLLSSSISFYERILTW